MAPAASLARLRKWMMDRVARKEVSVIQACREAGISPSRFYELRARYLVYGEAGLMPRPRPPRPGRQLGAPLRDQIVAYAIEHPTVGPRTIAAALALPRFGAWRVSHGGVYNVLVRAGLQRRSARLAAAESLAATEGGPITERVLRDLRAIERASVHIGSDTVGEQVFFDTMYIGNLKGVGKIWQYTAVDGACSFAVAKVLAGEVATAAGLGTIGSILTPHRIIMVWSDRLSKIHMTVKDPFGLDALPGLGGHGQSIVGLVFWVGAVLSIASLFVRRRRADVETKPIVRNARPRRASGRPPPRGPS